MASILFDNFRNTLKEEKDHSYLDLHLDIEESKVLLGDSRAAPTGKDIRVDKDEQAIKNSIINIFNTSPGERFLIPEFGINLRQFLFEPVSDDIAQSIGDTIVRGIERWEPRVTIERVVVMARPGGINIESRNLNRFSQEMQRFLKQPGTEDSYIVTISLIIPTLRNRTNLEGMLLESGFMEPQYTFS